MCVIIKSKMSRGWDERSFVCLLASLCSISTIYYLHLVPLFFFPSLLLLCVYSMWNMNRPFRFRLISAQKVFQSSEYMQSLGKPEDYCFYVLAELYVMVFVCFDFIAWICALSVIFSSRTTYISIEMLLFYSCFCRHFFLFRFDFR